MSATSQPPAASDVARRLLILKVVIVAALAAPPRSYLKDWMAQWSRADRDDFVRNAEADRARQVDGIRRLGLWASVTPEERTFLKSTAVSMTLRQQVDASWRMEAAQVLMWALGLIETLPPYDEQADTDLLIPISLEERVRFVDAARLRDRSVIGKSRDIAELWHWRSRTRQLIERGDSLTPSEAMRERGVRTYDDIVRTTARLASKAGDIPAAIDGDFPVRGKAYRDLTDDEWSEVRSITAERHFAFNWLCGYAKGNEWDKTPTET